MRNFQEEAMKLVAISAAKDRIKKEFSKSDEDFIKEFGKEKYDEILKDELQRILELNYVM